MLDDNGNNIIWTLCHHGHVIKDSAYILEKLMNVLPEESLKNNLDLLLLSGVKVFLQSPAESQHILGRDNLRLEFRFHTVRNEIRKTQNEHLNIIFQNLNSQ